MGTEPKNLVALAQRATRCNGQKLRAVQFFCIISFLSFLLPLIFVHLNLLPPSLRDHEFQKRKQDTTLALSIQSIPYSNETSKHRFSPHPFPAPEQWPASSRYDLWGPGTLQKLEFIRKL